MTVFAAVFLAAGGSLALWLDLRLQVIRPASWMRLGIAVVVVMVMDDVCAGFIHIHPPVIGVMGVGLPLITATLLVGVWMLRMMRSTMPI